MRRYPRIDSFHVGTLASKENELFSYFIWLNACNNINSYNVISNDKLLLPKF